MLFNIYGYAAPTVSTTSLLTNTATANAYLVGSTTPLVPQETAAGSVMVVSPSEPSGTVISPDITADYNGAGTCSETVHFGHYGSYTGSFQIEVASTPSQALYLDYLAPAGATVTSGQTNAFTISGISGTFTYSVAHGHGDTQLQRDGPHAAAVGHSRRYGHQPRRSITSAAPAFRSIWVQAVTAPTRTT